MKEREQNVLLIVPVRPLQLLLLPFVVARLFVKFNAPHIFGIMRSFCFYRCILNFVHNKFTLHIWLAISTYRLLFSLAVCAYFSSFFTSFFLLLFRIIIETQIETVNEHRFV